MAGGNIGGQWGNGAWGSFVWGNESQPNVGNGWLIQIQGKAVDYVKTTDGHLCRDPTLRTRCLIRLMTRRGEWFGDPELGSLLHTIQHLKNADAQVARHVAQALQPMIDDGSINKVTIVELVTDFDTGTIAAHIEVEAAGGDIVPLGDLPLESGA